MAIRTPPGARSFLDVMPVTEQTAIGVAIIIVAAAYAFLCAWDLWVRLLWLRTYLWLFDAAWWIRWKLFWLSVHLRWWYLRGRR